MWPVIVISTLTWIKYNMSSVDFLKYYLVKYFTGQSPANVEKKVNLSISDTDCFYVVKREIDVLLETV